MYSDDTERFATPEDTELLEIENAMENGNWKYAKEMYKELNLTPSELERRFEYFTSFMNPYDANEKLKDYAKLGFMIIKDMQ